MDGGALFEALEEQLEGVGSLEEGLDGHPGFSIDVPDPECFAKAVASAADGA